MLQKSRFFRTFLIFLIISLNWGCDQHTKQMAVEQLRYTPGSSFFNDTFLLIYAENKGAFLSIGADMPETAQLWLLHILPIAALLVLTLFTLFSRQISMIQMVAMSCIIGGGMSNIYDRILYGSVVDFMNLGIGSFRTGIFNFADVSIMFGLFLLLIFNGKRTL